VSVHNFTGGELMVNNDILIEIAEQLTDIAAALTAMAGRLSALVGPDVWTFPVGSERFPLADWYCAQYHTYHRDTNPGGHTGLDLNGDRSPWGDVDRDEPVFAVARGTVHDAGFSEGWRGVVVIRVEHDGAPLWVRYAHLAAASIVVSPGEPVTAGQELGRLGNYSRGDHLHFDMARDPFGWNYWRARSVGWVDPLPVLLAHLEHDMITLMLDRA
jgi:murein DD-endopeptidase MepM/ murein hydrolase activator NlpD